MNDGEKALACELREAMEHAMCYGTQLDHLADFSYDPVKGSTTFTYSDLTKIEIQGVKKIEFNENSNLAELEKRATECILSWVQLKAYWLDARTYSTLEDGELIFVANIGDEECSGKSLAIAITKAFASCMEEYGVI